MINKIKYMPGELSRVLAEDGISVVITGDSLAYNRYDFDHEPRVNAYDCYPGMPSWSFMLRDAIHQNDKWYVFGDEINYQGRSFIKENALLGDDVPITGNAPESYDHEYESFHDAKYSCLNHGKTASLFIDKSDRNISFLYSHSNEDTNKAVLYMQKRPDEFSCSFDIYLDGKLALSGINIDGKDGQFQGWEPFEVEIPVKGDGKPHEITFRNIRNVNTINNIKKINKINNIKHGQNTNRIEVHEGRTANLESRINIAGIGTKRARIHLTGNGGKTTQYFLDNMEERIMQYEPDVLIFIIGANDRAYLSVEEFNANLRRIMNIIKGKRPACEILLITPPSSANMEKPAEDNLPVYITDKSSQSYIEAMYRISREYGCMFLNLIELLKNVPIKEWRYDNVHFTKYGNTLVAKAVLNMLLGNGGYYRKELVNAEVWF
ncbi:MAG TPA: GDSL-type esterase/lipase family protein [Clostridiales bacterium]|nr:GDSL-type esterase/lipase family protein [Clostridiales bacterium]